MTDLKLTTAQRRILTERGKQRVETDRRLADRGITGRGETYLTSDKRVGEALVRRGLVTAENERQERYWQDFRGRWQSTTDRWTSYWLTTEGILLADELGTEALEEER